MGNNLRKGRGEALVYKSSVCSIVTQVKKKNNEL